MSPRIFIYFTFRVTGGGMRNPDGSMQPQQDFTQSDLARMIHQEDARAKGGRGGRPVSPYQESARNIEHRPGQEMRWHGYQDQNRQSPSMFALEQSIMHQPAQGGASDF